MRQHQVKWFVNFSIDNPHRTVEIRHFDRLSDAKDFADGKFGYIVRQEWDGWYAKNSIYKVFGGFDPSATESRMMEAINGEGRL